MRCERGANEKKTRLRGLSARYAAEKKESAAGGAYCAIVLRHYADNGRVKARDFAALLMIAALWGGSYIFIRILVVAIGPWGTVCARMLIAAVAAYGVLRLAGLPWGDKKLLRHYCITAFLASFLAQGLIANAAQTLNAATLAILNSSAPLFSAMMLFLFFGEPLAARRAYGLLLGMAGVSMVAGFTPLPFTSQVMLAFAGAIGAAACYAYSGIHTSRHLGGRPALELTLMQCMLAGLLSLPLAAPELAAGAWSIQALAALAALSLACTTFATWLFYGLMQRTGPVVTMSTMYVLPVFSLLWGWLFLDETITPLQLAGFGVILVALLLVAGRLKGATVA